MRDALREVGHLAGVELDVGAADPDALDVDEQLAPARRRGRRPLRRPASRGAVTTRARISDDRLRDACAMIPNSSDRGASSGSISAAPPGTAGRTATPTSTGPGCGAGNPDDALDGTKPQIAIANTASDLTPCNMHLNEVAESVKQGVWEAGGVPYNLPVVSLGETQVKPTAMLWRNMAAMAMEEMFRANPIDGVVLARRVRQDDPRAADGRGIRRHPRDRRPGRSDADRSLPRRGARLRHRRMAAERGGARRHDLERRVHCSPSGP